MLYTVPKLPYAYDALEPHIDAKTMEVHHDKHHQKYVDDLNNVLVGYPELQQRSLIDLVEHWQTLPEAVRSVVRNNAGGHLNHSFFWPLMSAKGEEPRGKVKEEITKTFGSFQAFQEQFAQAAKSRFGSGWAWLCLDATDKLLITSTPNQDNPITQGLRPILGLDVWEHAYYLKYQNRRPDYITAWWSIVNWSQVEENYKEMSI